MAKLNGIELYSEFDFFRLFDVPDTTVSKTDCHYMHSALIPDFVSDQA